MQRGDGSHGYTKRDNGFLSRRIQAVAPVSTKAETPTNETYPYPRGGCASPQLSLRAATGA